MRSSKSTEAYEQHIAGIIKDIAFHELLVINYVMSDGSSQEIECLG